jgi:hypothetical protein
MLVHGRRELWREGLLVREHEVQYEARSYPEAGRNPQTWENLTSEKIRPQGWIWPVNLVVFETLSS